MFNIIRNEKGLTLVQLLIGVAFVGLVGAGLFWYFLAPKVLEHLFKFL